ncbi:MAG: GDSL-type esterase/lipase family protein [Luteolibacter sp.]|uniref:GDSL-type esterase/lipase family protein n=1 Tax=Luteolibacter sp. TaxID=1962973 RepID=UPI003266A584
MKIILPSSLALFAALPALAVEVSLEAKFIELKAKDPVGTIELEYPAIFRDGADRSPARTVDVSNQVAHLTYGEGIQATLESLEGGKLVFKVSNLPDGNFKVSQQFTVAAPGTWGGKVRWSINDSEMKVFPEAKSDNPFLYQADGLRLLLQGEGSEGVGITLPFGYTEFKDRRAWTNPEYQWTTFSHLPRNGAQSEYLYEIKSADGSPVTRAPAKIISTGDTYTPYPEAREELWPGKGPIRTFGWQDGIRRKYFDNRAKDENAIVFVGDSLTENWRTVQADFPKYKIANRGVGGDTSRGVLFRFQHDVLCLNPQMVFLCAGSNDLTAHGNPDDAVSNIEAILKMAVAFNDKMPVVISSVAPSSNPQAPLKPGAREALNAGLVELVKSYPNARLFDLSAACMGPDGQQDLSLYEKDQLHFGAKGYVVWKAGLEKLFADLLKPTSGAALAPINLSRFKLVWQDEFDGTELDRTKWDTPHQDRQGASRWDGRNVSVANGVVTIKILKTDDPIFRYESACIRTSKGYDPKDYLFSYKYGYLETRLRLPNHVRSDYWTGFWLLAGDVVAGRNTDTRLGTEIDIFENFNQWNLGQLSHNLHWGGYAKDHNSGGKNSGPHLELFDGQFHTFGLYWDEAKYIYTIDGVSVQESDAMGLGAEKGNDGNPLAKSQGTCRNPAFIKVSVEGAPWCGPTGQWESVMPAEDTLLVDYVRLYQTKSN